jgi:hypothetical protein
LKAGGAFTGGLTYLDAGLHEHKKIMAAASGGVSAACNPAALVFFNFITHLPNPMP